MNRAQRTATPEVEALRISRNRFPGKHGEILLKHLFELVVHNALVILAPLVAETGYGLRVEILGTKKTMSRFRHWVNQGFQNFLARGSEYSIVVRSLARLPSASGGMRTPAVHGFRRLLPHCATVGRRLMSSPHLLYPRRIRNFASTSVQYTVGTRRSNGT